MDIKKTTVSEIHKTIPDKDYKDLYNRLKTIFGSEMPFAEFNIGSGFYVWSAPGMDWQASNSVDEVTMDMVKAQVDKIRSKVAEKIGEADTEKIFIYPDDSYLFFRPDGDKMQVIVTGWGFRYPVNRVVRPDRTVIDTTRKNPIEVSFSLEGEKLPNHEFLLRLPKIDKKCVTTDLGTYRFDDLQPGTSYTLVDPSVNRTFTLNVEKGKTEYDFDITVPAEVQVRVNLNNAPCMGEPVNVHYNGKEYPLVTDEQGMAAVTLPFLINQSISVSVRDLTDNKAITEGENTFEFNLVEAEPEVPAQVIAEPEPVSAGTLIVCIKDSTGLPVPGYGVTIDMLGGMGAYASDQDGNIIFADIPLGTDFRVIDNMNPQNVGVYRMVEGQDRYDFIVDVARVNGISFRVVDAQGYPVRGTITFHQDGLQDMSWYLDEQGQVIIPIDALNFGVLTTAYISDQNRTLEPVNFTLDAGEYDYVLQEQAPQSNLLSTIMLVLSIAAILVGVVLCWKYFETMSNNLFNKLYL